MLFGTLQPNIEIGQNLTPAAQVAGPWEALVAPGEVAGFSLQITTNADEKVRFAAAAGGSASLLHGSPLITCRRTCQ